MLILVFASGILGTTRVAVFLLLLFQFGLLLLVSPNYLIVLLRLLVLLASCVLGTAGVVLLLRIKFDWKESVRVRFLLLLLLFASGVRGTTGVVVFFLLLLLLASGVHNFSNVPPPVLTRVGKK